MNDHMYLTVRDAYRQWDDAMWQCINQRREYSSYFAGFPNPRQNPYAS